MELTRRQLLCTLPAVPWTLSACGLEAHPTVPDLPFTQIDGSQHRLADLKGKVMVINFWATSCSTCVREMPEIVATHRKFEAQGLETLAVAMQYDPPAAVAAIAERRRLPFGVVIDNTGTIARSFGELRGTPITFVFDRQGRAATRDGSPDQDQLRTELGAGWSAFASADAGRLKRRGGVNEAPFDGDTWSLAAGLA